MSKITDNNTTTKVYKGLIVTDDYGENWDAIYIGDNRQPIAKIFERDFQGKNVSVRYYISDQKKNKEQLVENQIKQISGAVNADYSDRYSELTGYLWTDQEIRVGGHDLLEEICTNQSKYIYLEVDIHS